MYNNKGESRLQPVFTQVNHSNSFNWAESLDGVRSHLQNSKTSILV